MNKNIYKILLILFLSFFNISSVDAFSINDYINEETNYRAVIEDDANLLTETEIGRLKDEMIPLTKYGNIALKTVSENRFSTSTYASSYYYEKFSAESGTLLLIDLDNRVIYIFSSGDNYNVVTESKANIITDNIYKYASNEQYYECASMAFEQINTILRGGKIAEPMRYISNIFIAITCAFFINFTIVLINTNIRKAENEEILANCSISFNISDIQVVKTGQHREYSPRSTSSGGSSFSGGGSSGGGRSGGSSGGGGGHRF